MRCETISANQQASPSPPEYRHQIMYFLNASPSEKRQGMKSHATARTVPRGGHGQVHLSFAFKLYILLEDMATSGSDHIISWVEHGKAFKIHKPEEFEKKIQPRYFHQCKLASFVRQVRNVLPFIIMSTNCLLDMPSPHTVSTARHNQCYTYGFAKVENGPSRGAYVHPQFCRWDRAKVLTIGRNSLRERGRKEEKAQASFPSTSEKSLSGVTSSLRSRSEQPMQDSREERADPAIRMSSQRNETLRRRMDEGIECALPPARHDLTFSRNQQLPLNATVIQRSSPLPLSLIPVVVPEPWILALAEHFLSSEVEACGTEDCLEPRSIDRMVHSPTSPFSWHRSGILQPSKRD